MFIGEKGEKCVKPNKQFLNLPKTNLSVMEKKDSAHVTWKESQKVSYFVNVAGGMGSPQNVCSSRHSECDLQLRMWNKGLCRYYQGKDLDSNRKGPGWTINPLMSVLVRDRQREEGDVKT